MQIPYLARSPQLFLDGFRSAADRMFIKQLEYNSCCIGGEGQRVLQQLPYASRHTPVMSIHPETIAPGAACDMYFHHPAQWHSINCHKRVKAMVDCVAMLVLQPKSTLFPYTPRGPRRPRRSAAAPPASPSATT